jgi:hypothetical protein
MMFLSGGNLSGSGVGALRRWLTAVMLYVPRNAVRRKCHTLV